MNLILSAYQKRNEILKYRAFHFTVDIKPENIMFKTASSDAPLVLVDYGSGSFDKVTKSEAESPPYSKVPKYDPKSTTQVEYVQQHDGTGTSLVRHTTLTGSAFYRSPEMFGRTYTSKTDVWSAGVVLYVLVAGYPADALQTAFNMLHDSNNPETRRELLKALPHMPVDISKEFLQVLELSLTYRHRRRLSASGILSSCDVLNQFSNSQC